MTTLERDLKLSIQLEAIRQHIKTSANLAKQMQAKSQPSAKCNPIIAQEMRKDVEIWEAVQIAAEKAAEDLVAIEQALRSLVAPAVTAADVIPELVCTACKEQVVGTINGFCWACWDFMESAKQGVDPCDEPCCAGAVVQMPRRVQ